MFVQVVRGRTSDPGALHAALERWLDLSPSAVGFLGGTAGVTEDGRYIDVARYESEEAARRSAERPEQQAWWSDVTSLLEGDAVVQTADDVTVDLYGDPARAGFVQVIQSRATDPQRARELVSGASIDWASFRPDILGTVNIDHGDGGWTVVNYFTSETEAREGERKEQPPELQALMAELSSLLDGPVEFFDLTKPWLFDPR